MSNIRFQNALKGVAQATPPVWFMRQAGRYHAHYQALRKANSFMQLCKNPKLAAEVAMGPMQDFDFDVAILFSDLLFPLEALGMGLTYDPSPKLGWHLNENNLKNLRPWRDAIHDLEFQKAAVEETRKVLPQNKSLIGFVGGPWTLFTYAVEGEHKGNLRGAKTNLDLYIKFCEWMVPLLEANIALQFEGGAETVMVFDTAAGELSPLIYQQYVQPHLLRLAEKYPGKLGYYSKQTVPAHLTQILERSKFVGLGVDHRWEIPPVLAGGLPGAEKYFWQGNFDQVLLFAKPSEFESRLRDYLRPFQKLTPEQRAHWVCGLGHGVLPETPVENVRRFVQVIREVFA